jgi:Ca2+-binding RTX toxin-like protein
MPIWKFAPTSRDVQADTNQLAFNLGYDYLDDLPLTSSSSTRLVFEGPLTVHFPSSTYKLTLTGQGFSNLGADITGGTISAITLTIAGGEQVKVTGLKLSAEDFDDLAVSDPESVQRLETFLLKGADKITGTDIFDELNGMAGNDQIKGGGGTDYLDGGNGSDKLFGGDSGDYLTGGKGNDKFYGGQGDDEHTGGAGKDQFIFNTSVYGSGTDFIEDFGRGDKIVIDNDAFKGIGGPGKLDPSKFRNYDTGFPDADDRFYYSQVSGGLYYDPDGSGFAGQQVLFAIITNNAQLTAADILIIN